jgi:hypothetical protein
MEIHFTIGWAWVEFICHALAGFFYIVTGFDLSSGNPSFGVFTLVMAIGLTIIGAGL